MRHNVPGVRAALLSLWCIASLGLGWTLGTRGGAEGAGFDTQATLSILRSEQMSFLVARRTTTQIVIEHSESDLMGEWRGIMWANVIWHWGVDMLKLAGEDLVWDGTVLVIRLPEPELLDFAVEVGSVRFMSKSTALPKLLDISRGGWQRSVLEGRMKEAAMAYFRQQNLLPNRSEIAAQLNTAAPIIEASAGINLRFE